MREAEDVAREIECSRVSDGLGTRCWTHGRSWPCNDSTVRYVAAAIRERDAEVRAEVLAHAVTTIDERRVQRFATYGDQVKAETLAGFTREVRHICHCGIECAPDTPHRRLVGPWEPSDD